MCFNCYKKTKIKKNKEKKDKNKQKKKTCACKQSNWFLWGWCSNIDTWDCSSYCKWIQIKTAILFFPNRFMQYIIHRVCHCCAVFAPFTHENIYRNIQAQKKRLLSSSQNAEVRRKSCEEMYCGLFYEVRGGKWISKRKRKSDLSALYMESQILLSNLNYSICLTEASDSCWQIWEFYGKQHNGCLSCSLCWLNMIYKSPHCPTENIVRVIKNTSLICRLYSQSHVKMLLTSSELSCSSESQSTSIRLDRKTTSVQ